ncbi:hypothetical protein [Streptomyces sp. NPDC048481]|uniref:hypothetical protein n=1 Tax=Streptomyces sp. NPDC048481 TaxID=3365557 RepID=UPI0037150BCE
MEVAVPAAHLLGRVMVKAALANMGGHASYRYGPPGPPWRTFGLEAQASLVEGWWAGRLDKAVGGSGGETIDIFPVTGTGMKVHLPDGQ